VSGIAGLFRTKGWRDLRRRRLRFVKPHDDHSSETSMIHRIILTGSMMNLTEFDTFVLVFAVETNSRSRELTTKFSILLNSLDVFC
jgi:hypothetical protein